MSVWVEVSTNKFHHGGQGWEFGTCIWSPSTDRRGLLGRYRIMLDVTEGDLVINCCDFVVRGVSIVAGACIASKEKPPNPGLWGYAKTFFRIPLADYRPQEHGPSIPQIAREHKDEISKDIMLNRPKYYLFSWCQPSEWNPSGKLVLSQGRFLARATPVLAKIILSYLNDARVLDAPK